MGSILHPNRRISTPAMATVKAAAKSPWSLRVRNLATRNDGDVFEMVINGLIGESLYDESCTASNEFRSQFNARPKGSKVHVRVNSDGGSVKDALGIFNICNDNRDLVTTFNDGYALSSASVVMCGGGRSVSPDASIWMIHEPWSGTVGDESDHLKSAEMLATHGKTLAKIYADRMGTTPDEMRALMKRETWYTGAEARAAGLADDDGDEANESVIPEGEEDSQSRAKHFAGVFAAFDFSRFEKVPKRIQNHVRACIKAGNISTPATASGAATKTTGTPGTNDIMDKQKILAALKDAGIDLPSNATDEAVFAAFAKLGQDNLARMKADADAKAKATATPTPAAATGDSSEVKALREQLDSEKRIRITAAVRQKAENRIENSKLDWWVNLALKDEAGTLAQIDGLPINRPGGEPLGVTASVIGTMAEQIKKLPTAEARYGAYRANWAGLYGDAVTRDNRRGAGVQNANTFSATLVTDFLVDGAETKLQNVWAPLRTFTRDYSVDRYKPRATGQLKYVTGGTTVQTNASNFESGDSVVAPVSIDVDQYTAAFHVTNDELNSGLRMENLIDVNIAALANKILAVAFSPLATGSFTSNAAIVRAAAAFSFSDMATAMGSLKKSPIKYAILDGEYAARIYNTPGFFQVTGTANGSQDAWQKFGWNGVYTNSTWSGTHAGADDQNIRGLFCNPQVLGAIAGLPLTPPNANGAILQQSRILVPGVDISVECNSWFSLATRTQWMSYDIMFGAALLDESAGVLLTSA